MKYKAITQKHPMGCGIACVASLLGISYSKALSFCSKPEYAWTRGFYLKDLREILEKGTQYKRSFKSKKYNEEKDKKLLLKPGSIVFLKRCEYYPEGHYLLRVERGWMNPWANLPVMTPAKAKIEKELKGEPQWLIYEV